MKHGLPNACHSPLVGADVGERKSGLGEYKITGIDERQLDLPHSARKVRTRMIDRTVRNLRNQETIKDVERTREPEFKLDQSGISLY